MCLFVWIHQLYGANRPTVTNPLFFWESKGASPIYGDFPDFYGASQCRICFVLETRWSRWRACSQMVTNRRTMSWRPAPCWGWNVLADVWLEDRLKHKQTEEVKLRCYLYKLCIILRYLNSFLAWSLGSSILEHPPRYELQDIWSKKERLIKDVSHIPFQFGCFPCEEKISLKSTFIKRQVMIPEVACRHLIGARGDRIKLLREESRCEASTASGLREFAEESTSKLPFNDDISNGIYIYLCIWYIYMI